MRESFGGGIADRAVAGAAAKIAAELFVELRAGLEILAVITFEERHDETGRAVTALRSEIFHHRLLDRDAAFPQATPSTVTMSRPAMSGSGTRQLLIDAITTFAACIAVDDRDRARAAIAFRAAFLRTGQSVEPQPFEQGDVRRNRIDANDRAVQPKLEHSAHLERRFCRILRNERERISSSVKPGGERFRLRDCAAGDAAQEKIEQSLSGRGIVEDVAEKRSERRLFDKRLQPIRSALEAFEEERINRGVTSDELRRMQIPALIKSGAQRMQIVVETEPPGRVNRFTIFDLLFLRQ